MSKPPLSRGTAPEFLARIEKLRADSPRKFGKMDTNRMLRHMRNAVETSLGETDLPDKSIPGVRSVLFFVMTNIITTWPGGGLKAPDFWSPPAEHDFDEERKLFLAATERFLTALDADPSRSARHPIFGGLTLGRWSRLHGIHLHHHLRQFGV